jgi:hypothetical protein
MDIQLFLQETELYGILIIGTPLVGFLDDMMEYVFRNETNIFDSNRTQSNTFLLLILVSR